MPVIKSAIKKLRRDKKQEKAQDAFRVEMDKSVKTATKKPTAKTVSEAFSIIDKAVKKHIIHQNKAGRMKSKLSALLPKKTPLKKETIKTEAQKTEKKKPVKKAVR